MTPIEKANELFVKYGILATDVVDEIIDAFISGGRDSFELQNMDKELRFWY